MLIIERCITINIKTRIKTKNLYDSEPSAKKSLFLAVLYNCTHTKPSSMLTAARLNTGGLKFIADP